MLIILNVTRSACFDCGGGAVAAAVLRRCINLALNMFVCLFAGFCLMFFVLFSVLAQFFSIIIIIRRGGAVCSGGVVVQVGVAVKQLQLKKSKLKQNEYKTHLRYVYH